MKHHTNVFLFFSSITYFLQCFRHDHDYSLLRPVQVLASRQLPVLSLALMSVNHNQAAIYSSVIHIDDG